MISNRFLWVGSFPRTSLQSLCCRTSVELDTPSLGPSSYAGKIPKRSFKIIYLVQNLFPLWVWNIWDGSCHLSFIDLCDKKYYAAKTEQQQWWILQITGMSCPRHRLSLVAKSRQCLQLFSSSSPRIFVCGSNPMWRRDINLPGGCFCECPFTAHCGCKCVHWAVPVPSIVTFASHIRSSCRLFRLWYLTCCEQNPVLRLVVYLWCELSSITGQACRQSFTKCNVYLQKGSKLPFFKYHRFVRPPDFLALVAISCPKSLRGLVGDWAGSVHGARPEISGCARAEHQPPGPLKQRQQATAYLERIHMILPTSNCLQSSFQYVNFVMILCAHL